MQKLITFIKGDKSSSETDFRDSLPVNMTGIVRPIFESKGYMIETEGVDEFATAFGPDRGGLWNEKLRQHFRLSSSHFVSISAAGNVTDLGTILGADQASFPYSFSTQGIVADRKFYLYEPMGGLVQVVDPNVRLPIDACWIDGYYCLTDGSYLYHTTIDNSGVPVENVINPLAVAVESLSPTDVVGVARSTDNMWMVFTRYGIDYYQNVGGSTFAFERIQGRALSVGLVATHAKAFLEDIWFFVGSRKYESLSVFGMVAGDAKKIATRNVEKILAGYTESELTNIVLETRQLSGYSYLILHLPREVLFFNYTLSLEVGVEYAWSILTSEYVNPIPWQSINGVYDPRVGYWIYGNKSSGLIGRLNETHATQYGEIQEWRLDTPFMNLDRMSVDQIEVLTVPGFTSESDATVFISYTNDGVFYSQEDTMAYGDPGAYGQRFIKRVLGYVRKMVSYRLRGASKSRMVFSQAVIDYG